MKWFFAFLIPFFAFTAEDTEQIHVQLTTENQLMPLYLAPFHADKAELDINYLQSLQRLLMHDLSHNGATYLSKSTPEIEALLKKQTFQQMGSFDQWKPHRMFYLVKVQIKNKMLSAKVLSVISRTVKNVENLPLTGQLSHDRRQVHLLADAIHKALFGTEGVASTRILYTIRQKDKETNDWTSEVWESDSDGANARQVTSNSGYVVTPAYFPPQKGRRASHFLYTGYKTGQPKIYIAPLAVGTPQRLTYFRGNQLMPSASRQQNQIAFISDYTGNPDLFVVPFDPANGQAGKPRQTFTHPRATQGTPVFSPDGKRVAFVSNKDGAARVYVMKIPEPGTHLKDLKPILISKYNPGTAPSWSPDGKKIAYCAKTKGVRQIWYYDLERETEKQLTAGGVDKENPSWAPDSLHLVYNTTGVAGSDLYVVSLNQLEPVRITAGSGEKRFPSWEPR